MTSFESSFPIGSRWMGLQNKEEHGKDCGGDGCITEHEVISMAAAAAAGQPCVVSE